MELIEDVEKMRALVEEAKAGGRLVGFVPTMGFFHEGHLELMRAARRECDVVVVSVFVNPTQFSPGEDYADYPRDPESDRRMAEREGVDYLFTPGVDRMYPEGFQTSVEVEELSRVMCGASRPGHFRGVATVVAKLFNIIPAQRAYFGQKDAQQLLVVRRMVEDLNLPVQVVPVPTVREADGLALSSRNVYLEPEERTAAASLYRALEAARSLVRTGERSAPAVRAAIGEVIGAEPLVELEYTAICDNINLHPLEKLAGEVLIALAARVGKARLIDNIVVRVDGEDGTEREVNAQE